MNAKCHSKITIQVGKGENIVRAVTNYIGEDINEDIEISAINAFINAVNQAYVEINYRNVREIIEEKQYA